MIGGLAETVVGAGGVAADYGPVPVVLFYVFAAMTVGAGFSVALARNIVRAAVGLLFALVGMSGLYFLLHAEYLAAVQLVVYVGGTLILIVFGVMLTSKSPTTNYDAKRYEVVWAVVIGVLLVVPLGWLMLAARWHGVSAAGGGGGEFGAGGGGWGVLD